MFITTKQKIIEIFGAYTRAADAMGVTRQCITNWPDALTKRQSDWVTGAAVRTGKLMVVSHCGGSPCKINNNPPASLSSAETQNKTQS